MSQERMAVEKQEKIKPLFPNTIWGWFVLLVATFICNQVMGLVWLNIAPGLLAVLFVLVQIYSIKTEKLKSKEISNTEKAFYRLVLPILFVLIFALGSISAGNRYTQTNIADIEYFDATIQWLFQRDNQWVLVFLLFVWGVIFAFVENQRVVLNSIRGNKADDFPDNIINEVKKSQEMTQNVMNEVQQGAVKIESAINKLSQVGYTATCIPIKYNQDHKSFVIVLIKNESHKECQWMFPGSHVDITSNRLSDTFDLSEVKVTPGSIIEQKVKKEAGLYDMTFLDPNYDIAYYEKTAGGKKEEYIYSNTCKPTKTPVFNYLFRVNKTSKCYETQHHRCHYDFTYIGEYKDIQEKEAEYATAEIEISGDIVKDGVERAVALEKIKTALKKQINKKINSNPGNRKKQNIPYENLCFDSIAEMAYNALLFYSDYINSRNISGS